MQRLGTTKQLYKALKGEVMQAEAVELLAPIQEVVEDHYKGKAVPEQGESAAARMLRMFPPTRSRELRAKSTTVTEEVTVSKGFHLRSLARLSAAASPLDWVLWPHRLMMMGARKEIAQAQFPLRVRGINGEISK